MNSDKKTIVLLIPSLKRGGAERVVSRLSGLLKNNYNLKVVVFNNNHSDYEVYTDLFDLNEAGADSKSIHEKIFSSVRRIQKFQKYKKDNDVDITYSFGNTANIVNVLSKGKDKKIVSIRGYGNLKLNEKSILSRIIARTLKIAFTKSDKIISVSDLIKNTIVNNWKIKEDKVVVVHNGIDTLEISQKAKDEMDKHNKSIREKLEELRKEGYFIFASMGSYRKEKGYDVLLKSFEKFSKNNPNSKLIILGTGDFKNTSELEKFIEELNLSDKVILTGFQKNPYSILNLSDCYVLSSRSEGFPNALVEAMAVGLPVISTDCPSGPREILIDSNTERNWDYKSVYQAEYGFLVEALDKEETNKEKVISSISKAMEEMVDNVQLRDNYKSKSLSRAQEFSFEKWKEKHIEIFNELL